MRCFIALPLPPDAREELVRWASAYRQNLGKGFAAPDRESRPRLSWTKSEGYHLTLAFLGEIEGRAVEIAAASLDAAAGGGEIPFSFAGLGVFPRRGAWRVLFARIADEGKSAAFHARVNRSLAELAAKAGLPPLNPEWRAGPPASGRGFEPHVTLARAGERGGSGIPQTKAPPLITGEWTIRRCSLYKSELRRGGAVYTELRGVDLSGK
ncbi:MAG: RNA 2',3'-cyclic phosphodiesterase [Rectinemataceae bacterium]|jgi:2'-5' RNA ligase